MKQRLLHANRYFSLPTGKRKKKIILNVEREFCVFNSKDVKGHNDIIIFHCIYSLFLFGFDPMRAEGNWFDYSESGHIKLC